MRKQRLVEDENKDTHDLQFLIVLLINLVKK